MVFITKNTVPAIGKHVTSFFEPLPPVTVLKLAHGGRDPLSAIRAACSQEIAGSGLTRAITNITMIGAVYRRGRLGVSDRGYLKHSIDTCRENDFPVSNNFVLTALNNRDDARGDFLTTAISAHLLIAGYIYDGESPQGRRGRFTQSPHHYEPGIWYRSAVNSGAKAIVIFGDPRSEVTADHFRPADETEENIYVLKESRPVFWPGRITMSFLVRKDFFG